jgi:hypothetical protein
MKPNLKRIEASVPRLRTVNTASATEPSAANNRAYSFEIRNAAQKRNASEQTPDEGRLLPSQNLEPEPNPAQDCSGKAPTLPKFDSHRFSSHNSTKPASGMNLLPKMPTDIAACKAELQQIVRQIQDLYQAGPIVDGWLESHPNEVTCESPQAGYLLCGLDATGKRWSHPCPPEQLPSISIAIARYQKLCQLLEQKQHIETLLSK